MVSISNITDTNNLMNVSDEQLFDEIRRRYNCINDNLVIKHKYNPEIDKMNEAEYIDIHKRKQLIIESSDVKMAPSNQSLKGSGQ
jgi:hypothetical protein